MRAHIRFSRWKAYTLLEILVVLAIIGVLMTAGLGIYSRVQETAYRKATEMEMKQIIVAVFNYKLEFRIIPESIEKMKDEEFLSDEASKDAWNTLYRLEYNEGDNTLKIISAGQDKKFGTKDDLYVEEKIF